MHNQAETLSSSLVGQAAMHERDAAGWEQRFTQLFRSGLLTMVGNPGKAFALRVGNRWAGASNAEVRTYFFRAVLPALRSGCTLGLDLSALGWAGLYRWTGALEGLLSAHGMAAETVLISVDAAAAMLDGKPYLGHRPGSSALAAAIRYGTSTASDCPSAWSALVERSYVDPRIRPVPLFSVRPLSALHGVEKGQAVMPQILFDAPSASAWLTLEIDARHLAHAAQIRRQLGDCLRFADNLIDSVEWPQPALRLDALLNRRVALQLTHVGDLLADQGLAPGDPASFKRLQRWLWFIRTCFVHESRLLAHRRGPFPELCASELLASLTPRYGVADARRLMRNRMLRHRHLFAMSPLTIFPAADKVYAAAEWMQLLPVVACADAITMSGPDVRRRLSLREWARLLQLTAAIAMHRHASSQEALSL